MILGEYGYEDGQFRGPHSLAMDSQGRLFVADRGNRGIQILDQVGNHLDTWYQFSRISGLYSDAHDVLYAIDSESDPNYNPGWRKGLRGADPRVGEVRATPALGSNLQARERAQIPQLGRVPQVEDHRVGGERVAEGQPEDRRGGRLGVG
jgi:hypothetical protein